MVESVFRYFLIVAVLILIFGFGARGFSATLADAYGVLTGNGWTAKDALGFLGTSIAGTLAMNPSLAPAAAAGALSAYIVVKGAQLYDIYRDWKNLRTGIAMLNPVEFSQSMSVKTLLPGEYGWWYIKVVVKWAGYLHDPWQVLWQYREKGNDNGLLVSSYSNELVYYGTIDECVYQMNLWIQNELPKYKDAQGRAMFTSLLNTAYSNLVSNNAYSATYSREVVAALESGFNSPLDSSLGYRVNVDPQNISEDGVQYVNDPDAFYTWFVTNYMNGTNEGTFVTPTTETYDEIRTKLETIITQLNNLSSGGGVSDETLNQLKTDIINSINSVTNTSKSDILSALESEFAGLDSTLTLLSNNVNSLQTDINTKFGDLDSAISSISESIDTDFSTLQGDIAGVKSSIDTVINDMNAAQEQEQGFWDGLMEWLDVTLWSKLQELLERLFLPTQEQLDELFDIEVPEYKKQFAADVSFSSQSVSMPISLFGATVNLSGYISEYASGLKTFMNILVSGLAAFFVIGAFRVHLNID